MPKPLILVLCTGNACRSPMAETFLRAVAGEVVEVASGGSNPATRVHPMMIEVMAEKGFDMSAAVPRHMDEYIGREVAGVITVCDHAERQCPQYPGSPRRYHWPFKDPVMVVGTEEMIRKAFRRARDELEAVFTAYGRGLADGVGLTR